jgi:MFS family permease
MSAIASEYQAANQAGWLGTSFLLATCTFTPLYGRLCTAMGRKGAQQVALVFAGIGTLACGLAPNINFLIVARFVTGIGGGGLFVTTG